MRRAIIKSPLHSKANSGYDDDNRTGSIKCCQKKAEYQVRIVRPCKGYRILKRKVPRNIERNYKKVWFQFFRWEKARARSTRRGPSVIWKMIFKYNQLLPLSPRLGVCFWFKRRRAAFVWYGKNTNPCSAPERWMLVNPISIVYAAYPRGRWDLLIPRHAPAANTRDGRKKRTTATSSAASPYGAARAPTQDIAHRRVTQCHLYLYENSNPHLLDL